MTVSQQPQILVIDDERDLLEIVRQALTADGCKVLTAGSATEGLQIFECQHREIDLVLLDYLLPEMTGDLVFECLQHIDEGVRVVLLTGCEDHVATKMFARGLRGYLQKPFAIEDLLSRVREELARP